MDLVRWAERHPSLVRVVDAITVLDGLLRPPSRRGWGRIPWSRCRRCSTAGFTRPCGGRTTGGPEPPTRLTSTQARDNPCFAAARPIPYRGDSNSRCFAVNGPIL